MIRQAHYTSVAHGPSGMSGFQFCALSDALDDAILRSVERLTTYQRPRDVSVDADISAFPVNLLYTQLAATDLKLLARVEFTGEDFSQRSGNYFAHSLILDSVPGDLSGSFPAEFWEAPFWQSAPGLSPHLPLLPSPAPAVNGLRRAIDQALHQGTGYDERLAWLTATADAAVSGGNQVLIIGPTDKLVWQWIMATSYLLGPFIAPRLSFCTYSHDPARAGTHLVGLVSSRPVSPARSAGFSVLNLGDDDTDTVALADAQALSCAVMLTEAGVIIAEQAWLEAASIARPASDQLAAWHPILACALVSLGLQVAATDLCAAIDWLASARIERRQHAAIASGFARQPLAELGSHHQSLLINDALSLDAEFASEKSNLAGAIEQALAGQALSRLSRLSSVPPIVRLRTRIGAEKAAADCDGLMKSQANARQRVAVLRWAAQAGVGIAGDIVSALGSEVMGLALVDDTWNPDQIREVARDHPEFRAGMVGRLAGEPEVVVDAASEYFAADIFEPSDFTPAPHIGEMWAAIRASARSATPVEEFIEICQLRRVTNQPGLTDLVLLQRLWPSGTWSAVEAVAVASAFPIVEVVRSPAAAIMAQTFLRGPDADATERSHWVELAVFIGNWPTEVQRQYGAETAGIVKELRDIVASITYGPPDTPRVLLITRLTEAHLNTPPHVQAYLAAEIPHLILAYHPRPYLLLHNCRPRILRTFCELSREQLLADPHNTALAARLFVTRCLLLKLGDKRPAILIDEMILAPVVVLWTRRDITAIARQADMTQELGGEFNRWVKEKKRLVRGRRADS